MGLDTSHDCWHGPYSAFNRWRTAIAKLAGFPPLKIMDGHYDPDLYKNSPPVTGNWAEDVLIYNYWIKGLLPLKWEDLGDVGDGRLVYFLTHPDHEGEILLWQAKIIVEALTDLLALPSPYEGRADASPKADYDGFKPATERFIQGLKKAIEAGESVKFC